MKMKEITSTSNSFIKEVIKLKKKNERDKKNLFFVDGYVEISRAVEIGYKIKNIFFSKSFLKNEKIKLFIEKQKKELLIKCSKTVFEKISYRKSPDGILAVFEKKDFLSKKSLKFKKDAFFLIVESVEKPGNLGTIIRAADGAAVDFIIVCDLKTDIYNPNIIRSSLGTVFLKNIITLTTEEALKILKEKKIKIVATVPSAKKVYTEEDFKKPIAIAVGEEKYGLSEKFKNNADILVKIPMLGSIDSLNVSQATSILLYEVLRQRSV